MEYGSCTVKKQHGCQLCSQSVLHIISSKCMHNCKISVLTTQPVFHVQMTEFQHLSNTAQQQTASFLQRFQNAPKTLMNPLCYTVGRFNYLD